MLPVVGLTATSEIAPLWLAWGVPKFCESGTKVVPGVAATATDPVPPAIVRRGRKLQARGGARGARPYPDSSDPLLMERQAQPHRGVSLGRLPPNCMTDTRRSRRRVLAADRGSNPSSYVQRLSETPTFIGIRHDVFP